MTQTDIDQIHSLVHEGNKLAAVKLLKDTTHIGLKKPRTSFDDFFLGKLTDLEAAVSSGQNPL